MTAKRRSRFGRSAAAVLLVLILSAGTTQGGEVRLPFSRYRLPEVSAVVEAGGDDENIDRTAVGEEEEGDGSGSAEKFVGAVMFGSGLFLCSWGIVDWQSGDTQCCPARNTENVAKIIVGVVLVNAGLVYLIAGGL